VGLVHFLGARDEGRFAGGFGAAAGAPPHAEEEEDGEEEDVRDAHADADDGAFLEPVAGGAGRGGGVADEVFSREDHVGDDSEAGYGGGGSRNEGDGGDGVAWGFEAKSGGVDLVAAEKS
jgi:hypothetical protein